MKLTLYRYDPDKDAQPYYKDYDVELEESDRVLDGLNAIKWDQDGTLTYRRSCAHGVCGSDAMRINGKNRLACTLLIKDVTTDAPWKLRFTELLDRVMVGWREPLSYRHHGEWTALLRRLGWIHEARLRGGVYEITFEV